MSKSECEAQEKDPILTDVTVVFVLTDMVTIYSLFTLGELQAALLALLHTFPELLFCGMRKETAGKQTSKGGAEAIKHLRK